MTVELSITINKFCFIIKHTVSMIQTDKIDLIDKILVLKTSD